MVKEQISLPEKTDFVKHISKIYDEHFGVVHDLATRNKFDEGEKEALREKDEATYKELVTSTVDELLRSTDMEKTLTELHKALWDTDLTMSYRRMSNVWFSRFYEETTKELVRRLKEKEIK
jgi:hypothetical protein